MTLIASVWVTAGMPLGLQLVLPMGQRQGLARGSLAEVRLTPPAPPCQLAAAPVPAACASHAPRALTLQLPSLPQLLLPGRPSDSQTLSSERPD